MIIHISFSPFIIFVSVLLFLLVDIDIEILFVQTLIKISFANQIFQWPLQSRDM